MRVERRSNSTPEDLLLLSDEDAELEQTSDEDLVREKVDVIPVDSGAAEGLGFLVM